MATNNAVNTPLSGSTGTGNFLGSTNGPMTTPNLGAATGTSITYSPTTNGTVGTPTNNNASAGFVGELIFSQVLAGSPVSVVNNVPKTITSISLTAGDWDVKGNLLGVGTTTQFDGGISLVNNTLPDLSLQAILVSSPASSLAISVPYQRLSLSTTTTVFLVGNLFLTGSGTMSGGIYARRRR